MFTIRKTSQYHTWFRSIKDDRAKARILMRLQRIELGNLGDTRLLRDGVSEIRVDYGPGYRVYFTKRQNVVIILLIGSDKKDQDSSIKKAIAIANSLTENDYDD